MFTRHAKFPGFQGRLGLRQVTPRGPEAAHANDNLRDLRRPTGQRRSPPPTLACHWVMTGANRLECRWNVENLDGIGVEEPDGPLHDKQEIRISAADRSALPLSGGSADTASAGFHITVFELSYQERAGWSGVEHGWLWAATANA